MASSLIAGRALANTWFFLGDLDAARRYAQEVIEAYDPAQHAGLGRLYSADVYVMCAFFLAHSLLLFGYPEQARPWRRAGLDRAREIADVVTVAHALHHTCLFEHFDRQSLALRAAAEELIACATEHSLPFAFTLWADLCYSVGEIDQGLRAVAEAKEFGARPACVVSRCF